MGIDQEKTLRVLRLSITCIFVFLITWYYQVPENGWALVTIWFVMYEYNTVGGVYTKSFLRITGTSLSALYGAFIVYFCANNPYINIMALIPGLFVYAYFFMGGDKTYIGTIGAVTLTIVLLNYNDIQSAILRVFNVMIGIVVSMVMIRLFYPVYSKDLMVETQLQWISKAIELVKNYLDPSISFQNMQQKTIEYEAVALANFGTYERLAHEAAMETTKSPDLIPYGIQFMHHFRNLCRLFSIFISYISTDELRNHPWIVEQFTDLLHELQTILQMLNEEKIIKKPESIKKEANEQNTPPAKHAFDNEKTIVSLVLSMLSISRLITEETKKIVLIHSSLKK